MRVLFALTANQEEVISQTYKEKYGEVLDVTVVYFFRSLIDTVKKSAPFDRIIIHEDFEVGRKNKNKDVWDEYLLQHMDKVTDEANGASIIFLAGEHRRNDDKLLNKLFNIGVYNILIGQEGTYSNVCELIKNPRTKKEAKRYLEIDMGTEVYEDPNKVPEIELRSILEYYENNKNNKEKIISGFDNNLYEQYTIQKLKRIIEVLPANVRDILYVNSDKYRAVLGEVVKIVEVPVYVDENKNIVSIDNSGAARNKNNGNVEVTENKSKKNLLGFLKKDRKNLSVSSNELNKKLNQEIPIKEVKVEEFPKTKTYYAESNVDKKVPDVVVELKDNKTKEVKDNDNTEQYTGKMIEFDINVSESKIESKPFSFEIPEEEVEIPKIKEEPVQIEVPEENIVNIEMPEEKEEPVQVEVPEENIVNIEIPEIKEEPLQVKVPEENMVNIEMPEIKEEPVQVKKLEKNSINIPDFMIDSEQMENEKQESTINIDVPDQKVEPVQSEISQIISNIDVPGITKEDKREENNIYTNSLNPQFQTVTQVIEKEVIKEVFETPSDYKKTVAFIGAHKVGTTFVINAIASLLTSKGIKTAILDLTKNKSTYSIYAANSSENKQIAANSIKNLALGQDAPLKLGDLRVYTGLPRVDRTKIDGMRALEKIRNQNAVILVDCDFTTNIDIFRLVNNIFVVQDMDITNILDITSFLKELKVKDIDFNKVEVIINKYSKSLLTPGKIIEAISYYTNPEMTFIDELLPKEVKRFIVPFDEQNYVRYIEALYSAKMNFAGFSEEFKQSIVSITHDIFPISSTANVDMHSQIVQAKSGGIKNLFKKKK